MEKEHIKKIISDYYRVKAELKKQLDKIESIRPLREWDIHSEEFHLIKDIEKTPERIAFIKAADMTKQDEEYHEIFTQIFTQVFNSYK